MKDRQAEKIAQEQGWKAPSDIIEAEGNDVDETFRRIAADQQRIENLGIKLGPLGDRIPMQPDLLSVDTTASDQSVTDQQNTDNQDS